MPLPKRRHSHTRGAKRRTNWKLKSRSGGTVACPNCGEKMLPHHACLSCGYYRGEKVLEVKET